jgi:toxin ParE1/3/4
MAYKVIWTEEALSDIEKIAEYIEKDSPFHASLVVTKIFALSDLIVTFPFSGRVVPEEYNNHIREHFVYSYRVIYEVYDEQIAVIAVVHGKQSSSSLSKRKRKRRIKKI